MSTNNKMNLLDLCFLSYIVNLFYWFEMHGNRKTMNEALNYNSARDPWTYYGVLTDPQKNSLKKRLKRKMNGLIDPSQFLILTTLA